LLYLQIKAIKKAMAKLKIGITIGDINGIGTEVIIKALSDDRILDHFTPIIYGSSKVVAYYKNIVNKDGFHFSSISQAESSYTKKVNVLNCWEETAEITMGKATENGGKFAYIALDRAVRDFKQDAIDAIVTAPINKHAMKQSGFGYPGHTEYLDDQFKSGQNLMMMVSPAMRIALVTNHVPVTKLKETITKELIKKKLKALNESLKRDFGIEKPTIAVLGLNPHAGDEGSIGTEDEEMVKPVVLEAKKNGVNVMGPYPADGFFGSATQKKFDAILAMYHDQGLIPFKALSFGDGVNFTAGLPVVRTSPDHGTAYDIVGRNIADASSIRSALYAAMDVARNRKNYDEARENALVTSSKK